MFFFPLRLPITLIPLGLERICLRGYGLISSNGIQEESAGVPLILLASSLHATIPTVCDSAT